MKNILKVFTAITFTAFLYSCDSTINKIETNKSDEVIKTTLKNDGLSLKFDLKGISLERVKSFTAYLVKNNKDPFSSDSNVYPNDFNIQIDKVGSDLEFVFPNIPEGGPYYVILAGFDKKSSDQDKKNMTRLNKSLESKDKQWSISKNSLSINKGIPVFDDNSESFILDLSLLTLNDLKTNITPKLGKEVGDSLKLN